MSKAEKSFVFNLEVIFLLELTGPSAKEGPVTNVRVSQTVLLETLLSRCVYLFKTNVHFLKLDAVITHANQRVYQIFSCSFHEF